MANGAKAGLDVKVLAVGWDGVKVGVGGEAARVSWDDLRAAARQADHRGVPGRGDGLLGGVYAGLLAEAEAMARGLRSLRVTVHNYGGSQQDLAARTWAAAAEYMSGERETGRIVGVDFGQSGTRRYAEDDAARARKVLAERGYEVR